MTDSPLYRAMEEYRPAGPPGPPGAAGEVKAALGIAELPGRAE